MTAPLDHYISGVHWAALRDSVQNAGPVGYTGPTGTAERSVAWVWHINQKEVKS